MAKSNQNTNGLVRRSDPPDEEEDDFLAESTALGLEDELVVGEESGEP